MREYPEHENLHKVKDKSQVCGEFVEWLRGKGIFLAEYMGEKPWETLDHTPRSMMSLLAEFFDIDQKKIDAEKEQMLEEVRAMRRELRL